MLNNQQQKDAGKSVFLSSVSGLATTIAVLVTFVGTPPMYGQTIEWVQGFTANYYGYGWEDITSIVWFAICGFLIFFSSRASISTALMVGGLALATKLF